MTADLRMDNIRMDKEVSNTYNEVKKMHRVMSSHADASLRVIEASFTVAPAEKRRRARRRPPVN